MKRIGLISDTHGYLDEQVLSHFSACDEIWHAGDWGSAGLASQLEISGKIIRGVYGNIDGNDIRYRYPEQLIFTCGDVKVMIRHIGGYPPAYNPVTRKELDLHRPRLFISGHSHILLIMYDEKRDCLYMNPGAAGNQGWHKVRTLLRFTIDGPDIKDAEVIELGVRG